ncbi:(E2-independent) E3 ubiquitin-conjugating enzyme FATS isoform X2 [Oxyura jamaicensis]|uniref:(E2-independent) E3 ubiquitin-conjugating enzyme FATS isoform X2 n=1 Tax=Oxyura jamaicensis TaxID=8884 RepID=UPI0015A5D024|nr:(E2-independent) E3 ubiquitin-conjugating enzyme FATS isoform X2 [Oxyura jamaicensis]
MLMNIVHLSAIKERGFCGAAQKQWGSNRTCTGLQQESATERKSSSVEESLSSTSTKLISPIVISQMIDENKSKENWSALLMQSAIPQPSAYHLKQSLANHDLVNINSAFMVLPSRLEIQACLDDTTSSLDSPTTNEKQRQNQWKGFASITITARRVSAGSSDPAWRSRAVPAPHAASPTLSKVPVDLHHRPPPGQANQNVTPSKASECCSKSGEELRERFSNHRNKEKGLQNSDGREKVLPSFISSVHLQVSQQCPNTICYIDKSLNVCLVQPRIKCQKMHRSTLSFHINCSSSRLTADGVDGIANGEPIEEVLQTQLLRENKAPLITNWSAGLTENNVINKQTTDEVCLGTKYPLKSVCASELRAFDIPKGRNTITTKQHDNKQSGSYHTTFSFHLPNSSDEAGTQMPSGSQRKQCTTTKGGTMDSASLLDTASRRITAAGGGSLKNRDASNDTSIPKEIQAQGILKPRRAVSKSMCNTKTSSRVLLEENVHRQNQLLKSDYESCGSSGKTEEHEEEEERAGASREALSAPRRPDATHQSRSALARPDVSPEPERRPPTPLTLKEALEIHNPQFISRSQERLKKLEHMVQQRKAQQNDAPVSNQGVLPARKLSSTSASSKKKQYTIPHPLSDNLFKPKERFIPEKEMHMRSKRIYDNLPEVKKKQEEKQKRIIIQSNRVRVEIFKKQLLDQLLQRNTE